MKKKASRKATREKAEARAARENRKGAEQAAEPEEGLEGSPKARKRQLKGFRKLMAAFVKDNGADHEALEGDQRVGVVVSPVSTQSAIPYLRMFPDGICQVDIRRWSSCMIFDDVAWTNIREDEKEETGALWGEFLNGLSADIDIQVWMLSKSIDHKNFVAELALADKPDDQRGNVLRREFNAYVRSKLAASTKSMRRTRALVIITNAESHDEAAQKLGLVQVRAKEIFSSLDAECHVLDGQDRLDLIREVTRPDSVKGKATYEDVAESPVLSTRDLVAPDKIVRLDDGDLVVGNRYVRSYVVTKYARTVRDSFLSSLTQLPVDLTVSQYIRPWDHPQAIGFANKYVYDVGSEANTYKLQKSKPERGYFIDDDNLPPSMKDSIQAADALRYKIVQENQHMFSTTLILTVYAKDAKALAAACKQVETVFSEQLIEEVDHWKCLREQCWSSSLPVGNRLLPDKYQTVMLTEHLEVYAPFSSVEVMDKGGMLMGINADTNNFISYDQSLHEDTNVFVLGQPGKGKSVWSKLTNLQKFLREPNADIIVIDPEAENVGEIRAMGGTVIDLSETSRNHINLMEMSEFYGATDPDTPGNPLPRKVDFMQSAIKLMANSVSDEEKNVIDAACAAVYARYLETRNSSDLPTLTDFYEYLLSVEGTTALDARHLASLIQRFVTGTFSVFNHPTDVDLNNRVVDFVVTDLNDDLKPLAMMVVMDYVWTRVTENRRLGRRTYLLIDETQLLLEEPVIIKWLDRFFSRGRKWDFYITCVTQNVQRLLDIQECSYMFQNTPLLVLTGQSKQSADLLGDLLGLSENQARTLQHAQPGEGLYVFRHKVIHYDYRISPKTCPEIYKLITTRPSDTSGEKRERARKAEAARRDAESASALQRVYDISEAVELACRETIDRGSKSPFSDLSERLAQQGINLTCVGSSRELYFQRGDEPRVRGTEIGLTLTDLLARAKKGSGAQSSSR